MRDYTLEEARVIAEKHNMVDKLEKHLTIRAGMTQDELATDFLFGYKLIDTSPLVTILKKGEVVMTYQFSQEKRLKELGII